MTNTNDKEKSAIAFVMECYNKTEEEVRELYMDEVDAYMSIVDRLEDIPERKL